MRQSRQHDRRSRRRRVHRHRRHAPRVLACARFAPAATTEHVHEGRRGEQEDDERVERHDGEHRGKVGVQFVDGARDVVRDLDSRAPGGGLRARGVRGVVGDVRRGRAAAELVELGGGLVGVDEREQLDIRVSHAAVRIEVAEIVDGVDGSEDVVAYQPIAVRGWVREISEWRDGRDNGACLQLARADGYCLRDEGAYALVGHGEALGADVKGMDRVDYTAVMSVVSDNVRAMISQYLPELKSNIDFSTARHSPLSKARIEVSAGYRTINSIADGFWCITEGKMSTARAQQSN